MGSTAAPVNVRPSIRLQAPYRYHGSAVSCCFPRPCSESLDSPSHTRRAPCRTPPPYSLPLDLRSPAPAPPPRPPTHLAAPILPPPLCLGAMALIFETTPPFPPSNNPPFRTAPQPPFPPLLQTTPPFPSLPFRPHHPIPLSDQHPLSPSDQTPPSPFSDHLSISLAFPHPLSDATTPSLSPSERFSMLAPSRSLCFHDQPQPLFPPTPPFRSHPLFPFSTSIYCLPPFSLQTTHPLPLTSPLPDPHTPFPLQTTLILLSLHVPLSPLLLSPRPCSVADILSPFPSSPFTPAAVGLSVAGPTSKIVWKSARPFLIFWSISPPTSPSFPAHFAPKLANFSLSDPSTRPFRPKQARFSLSELTSTPTSPSPFPRLLHFTLPSPLSPPIPSPFSPPTSLPSSPRPLLLSPLFPAHFSSLPAHFLLPPSPPPLLSSPPSRPLLLLSLPPPTSPSSPPSPAHLHDAPLGLPRQLPRLSVSGVPC
ncbi:hypothetical protein C7M84_018395 [Penaeus vannamei]|uniref:Uncharacterized protein n=1 Tax=Penaeus vannamei TaxID=6689 RepID=A0A423SHP2_PENVA|nr:hypothetical protein C7M84_018395 [Penaeus vannamei]